MFSDKSLSRRVFLGATCAACAAEPESIIDIHQHTVYGQRDGEQLVLHQRAMGVKKTVLLPVGTRPGLAPGAGGNQSAVDLARKYPQEFVFFANAVPDDPNARREIEKFLKAGALGIGEQKYAFACDSEPMQRICDRTGSSDTGPAAF